MRLSKFAEARPSSGAELYYLLVEPGVPSKGAIQLKMLVTIKTG